MGPRFGAGNITLSVWGALFFALPIAGLAADAPKDASHGGLSGQYIMRSGDGSGSATPLNLAAVPVAARSLSGQFIIRDERRAGPSPSVNRPPNSGYVRIEPTLLTVSCERVKQEVIRATGGNAVWRGKIFLTLHSAAEIGDSVSISSEHYRDGWHYRVDLADQMERRRFVRAMVQVLLLEMANRNAGEHSAEIPAWLLEGLTQQILSSSEMELVIPPPSAMGNGVSVTATDVLWRRENPLEQAHKELVQGPLLTFEQLSWPTDQQLNGPVYQGSAQLFVSELIRLNNGKACLQDMLAQLPGYYNWQFAFLRAYHNYFQKALDVEKWWALQAVHFTGRELIQTWPLQESWDKLDALVREGIQIRSATNAPLHTEVSLQTIIREWDRARQVTVLTSKLHELDMLRMRVADPLVVVIDGYRQALENYLQHAKKSGIELPIFKKMALNRAREDAVQQLDALDSQRSELKPEKTAPTSVQARSNGTRP